MWVQLTEYFNLQIGSFDLEYLNCASLLKMQKYIIVKVNTEECSNAMNKVTVTDLQRHYTPHKQIESSSFHYWTA
jgi:hypothetical protein